MVSQDCVLFARSVRENIKYGYEDASDEEMYKAANLASAHEFIMNLTNGYDTGLTHRLKLVYFNWFSIILSFNFVSPVETLLTVMKGLMNLIKCRRVINSTLALWSCLMQNALPISQRCTSTQ